MWHGLCEIRRRDGIGPPPIECSPGGCVVVVVAIPTLLHSYRMPRYPPSQCKHCAAQVARSNTYLLGSAGNADACTCAHTAPTRARTLRPTRARAEHNMYTLPGISPIDVHAQLSTARETRTHTHRVQHIQTTRHAQLPGRATAASRGAESTTPHTTHHQNTGLYATHLRAHRSAVCHPTRRRPPYTSRSPPPPPPRSMRRRGGQPVYSSRPVAPRIAPQRRLRRAARLGVEGVRVDERGAARAVGHARQQRRPAPPRPPAPPVRPSMQMTATL